MPYGYYMLLRWLACIGFVWLAAATLRGAGAARAWPWVFGLLAVLFNPIAKIHMTKVAWAAVDVAAAAAVACHAFLAWRELASRRQ